MNVLAVRLVPVVKDIAAESFELLMD